LHKRFKALLGDVGLMQRLSGMPADAELPEQGLVFIPLYFAGTATSNPVAR